MHTHTFCTVGRAHGPTRKPAGKALPAWARVPTLRATHSGA